MTCSADVVGPVLNFLKSIDDVSYRAIMGDYTIFFKMKVVGGLYDDEFCLLKTPSSVEAMPDAEEIIPYDGADVMLAVRELDPDDLPKLFRKMFDEL